MNQVVISLLNVQPPKPAKPPPQFVGAMVIHKAEKIINGIANFFQELNICSFKKRRSIKITNNAMEKKLSAFLCLQ